MVNTYRVPEEEIGHYTCYRTRDPIKVDGVLSKPIWQEAEKSGRFVDMVTGEPGLFDTRMAALWDQDCLYVAFWIQEPFVEAQLDERDSIIFKENNAEVIIDGGDCYYELEINALGTIYEVFYVWKDAYTRGSRFDVPEFDILGRKALSFAGDYDRRPESFWRGTHPRGCRWAFLDWDFVGLRTAVRVEGKINDRTVVDRGWSVELAFPWQGMKWLANGRALPPQEGYVWRIFFGRFEKLSPSGVEIEPHPAWVLSKHGVYDTHIPECFPCVHFTNSFADLE